MRLPSDRCQKAALPSRAERFNATSERQQLALSRPIQSKPINLLPPLLHQLHPQRPRIGPPLIVHGAYHVAARRRLPMKGYVRCAAAGRVFVDESEQEANISVGGGLERDALFAHMGGARRGMPA